jgi:hypothetical protein
VYIADAHNFDFNKSKTKQEQTTFMGFPTQTTTYPHQTITYANYDDSLSSRINEEAVQPEGDATPPTGGGLNGDADIDSNWDETIETFEGLELPEELLRGIYAYGFEKPSAIQQRAIKPAILGRDLIAQAQSGTVSTMYGL